MNAITSIPVVSLRHDEASEKGKVCKPLISLVVPAYNEALIAEKHLSIICRYMESLEDEYRWELIVVNDGSTDRTGHLADAFARTRNNVYVLHHMTNFGAGEAFRSAFEHCQGDYIVTLDLDLSYAPDHIGKLLTKISESKAKIAVASPYMKAGIVSNVPWSRRILSICANRFLARTSRANLSTLPSGLPH
jgi:glycosyltransferase involved in cell wall biosynthesis